MRAGDQWLICQQKHYGICNFRNTANATFDRTCQAICKSRIDNEKTGQRCTNIGHPLPVITGHQDGVWPTNSLAKPHRTSNQRHAPVILQLFGFAKAAGLARRKNDSEYGFPLHHLNFIEIFS